MERKRSMNAFTHPQVQIGQERKRLYSWSRPSQHRPRKSQTTSELTIKGKSTLAFRPDGKWFKGNIISKTEDAYTISGRRRSSSNQRLDSVSELIEPVEQSGIFFNNSANLSAPTSSPLSCSIIQPSENSSESPSDIDSLDSELVRVAIESFNLEEDDCDALYDISILDYETGMNHSIKGVSAQMSSDGCRLVGDSLSFRSDNVNKGAGADMVIQKNLGQALTGRNLIVFQGDFEFTYSDMVCFPVSQEEASGQWCL